MRYVLGIDFGGGASKATLLGSDGLIKAENTVEYETYHPLPEYSEQNPSDWYDAAKENILSIIKKASVNPEDIEIIALDAATHTSVLCDENFNVLRPAIYWTDTRSTEEVKYIKNKYGDLVLEQALHQVDTIWTLPHLMWVKNNEPKIWKSVRHILFEKDYVRHMFTGDYVTDNIEAEGSMLFDYNRQCWSPELCEIVGLDISILPEVVSPMDTVGYVCEKAASETGLIPGTKVICGTTDTVMEVFAAGGVNKGDITVKLATAGRICVVTDKSYPDKNLINYSHISDGMWYPGTATKACASSYRWYRDTFGENYEELNKGAAEVEVGCDGLMYHPYLNGELTPYADPDLCASFIGVRSGHSKKHFTRAVLEGVSISLLNCLKELDRIGISHNDKAVIIGGGAKSDLWRQITADALGITLIQRKNTDSSFGTAMMAGVAAGFWSSLEEALAVCSETVSETSPNPENREVYDKLLKKHRAVHDALAPIYKWKINV